MGYGQAVSHKSLLAAADEPFQMEADISLLFEARPFRAAGQDDDDTLKTMKYVQSMYDAAGYALLEHDY